MEPVTHVLTGACLARAGLNRRAAYTTAAMAMGAELPDIDTLWGVRSPVSAFEHHRGITHTFVGLPFEAAFLLLLFWLFHRWRFGRTPSQIHAKPDSIKSRLTAPVRWLLLYGFMLLALLSHILLDFTNNYGIRPFFPFDPHWYAASIVFIFDPLIFLVLLGGLLLPTLFGLISQEVGVKRKPFRGAGWARFALVLVVVLWGIRAYEHSRAVALASAQVLEAPASSTALEAPELQEADQALTSTISPPEPVRPLLPALRSLASPDPLSVFRWYTATDFGPAYRLGTADTRIDALTTGKVLAKPSLTSLLVRAERTRLGQVYLDWSAMPWVTAEEDVSPGSAEVEHTVTFQDLRFLGSAPALLRGRKVPLTGEVVVDGAGEIVEEGMDGRFQPRLH